MEPGETSAEAAARESQEETGLRVRRPRVWPAPSSAPGRTVRSTSSTTTCERGARAPTPAAVRAGDDAAEVRWVYAEQLAELPCVEGLVAALARWALG